MQWTDEFRIETPEQIDVSLEIAGLGSRFVAQMIDWLFKIVWTALLALVMVILALVAGGGMNQAVGTIFLAAGIAMAYVLWLGYDIFYELKRNGQTPGKKFAGVRVIRDGGAPIDFPSACIRNLLSLADFLPGFYLLGGLLVLLTPRGQRLGDMAAGTLVIRERAVHHPVEAVPNVEQLVSDEFVFTSDQLAACGGPDSYILRSFFQRYEQMDGPSRQKLALRLAEQFAEKTGYQPTQPIAGGIRAEAFLASLYRSLEKKARHDR